MTIKPYLNGEDGADPKLSGQALDALAAFYAEQDALDQQYEDLKANPSSLSVPDKGVSMTAFAEDWNASQFWYNEKTAKRLAQALLQGCTGSSKIAIVSAPSVFVALEKLTVLVKARIESTSKPEVCLLEFDSRFEVFAEFVRYDFNKPFNLPGELKGQFDRIICDPPFLSVDCQTKVAETVQWLSKQSATQPPGLIVCTGQQMAEHVLKLYKGLGIRRTSFAPVHANNLSNEFGCFANFEVA